MTSCYFKENQIEHIDYKDTHVLEKFLNPSGRIVASKRTGVSRKMQKQLSQAIKRARFMALIPYINR
jgi:small subunit ribosomal protein S18